MFCQTLASLTSTLCASDYIKDNILKPPRKIETPHQLSSQLHTKLKSDHEFTNRPTEYSGK